MQLNRDYKLLSISGWACYSCKGHHYWEGYTKLQEGKSRLPAVRGNDGRWVCAVLRSSPLTDSGKQESMLLSRVTTTFPLNMWVVVQCILLTLVILWAALWCNYNVFNVDSLNLFASCLTPTSWQKQKESKRLGTKRQFLHNAIMIHRPPNFWLVIQK